MFTHKVRLLGLLVGAAMLFVLAACTSAPETAAPSIGDRLVVTEGVFDSLPLTAAEAEQAGWIDTGECVPNMGRHFLQMMGEQPGPVVLLYNPAGDLIGVELESLSEQPAPPWEHLDGGHPGMEFEHWTISGLTTRPTPALRNNITTNSRIHRILPLDAAAFISSPNRRQFQKNGPQAR